MNSQDGREQPKEREARVARRRRLAFNLGLAVAGRQLFTAPFGRKPYGAAAASHRTPVFCSALSSMPGPACCRSLKTLDPAPGGRRQVQPDSPARLAQAGTRTSRLVSPREDTPSGTPRHAR